MPNPNELLKENSKTNAVLLGKWPDKNIAVLVVHGIGNQKPIETLDSFSRGLLSTFDKYGKDSYEVRHLLEPKLTGDDNLYWFDNFLRISRRSAAPAEQAGAYIDIYEYYWANLTEDKTNISKINKWLKDVTSGAIKYYGDNSRMATEYDDTSIFTDSKGKFSRFRYSFFIRVLGNLCLLMTVFLKGLAKLIGLIPYIGTFASEWFEEKVKDSAIDLTNVLGDIAIYNDPNPRSSNQEIRAQILSGCVKALRCLVIPDEKGKFPYDRIVMAGHSLGSQVAFDAVNRLTHTINLEKLDGYDKDGNRLTDPSKNINTVLDTFITFGSPLDKIAFFLREQSDKKEYLRKQILNDFHCFKQTDWDPPAAGQIRMTSPIQRIFEHILWKNYYDNHDPVSGPLDFYETLTNVDCKFSHGYFTHSNYWENEEFYADIFKTLLR